MKMSPITKLDISSNGQNLYILITGEIFKITNISEKKQWKYIKQLNHYDVANVKITAYSD
jgi:hypothetical protein